MPDVHERYSRYVPPAWLRPTVERLLGSLAPEHIEQLESIVLTDQSAIGKGKTRRVAGRKYRRSDCRGFYHARSNRGKAWIELIADNIVASAPGRLLWFQFVRDMYVAETLYHEIGHHLDASVGAAKRSGEAAAEDWRRRLSRIHFRQRYRRIAPLLKLLAAVLRMIRRWIRR